MTCKNCGFAIDQSEHYCPNCGARVIHNRLTFKGLLNQFGEEFLNYDNKLLKTFVDLFKRPEVVIDGFVKGVRKRYVNPVGYFTLAISFAGLYAYIINKFFPDLMKEVFSKINTSEAQLEASMEFNSFFLEYQTLIFFGSIPFLAMISRVVFYNIKDYNYTEHLVLNIYAYSQASLISTLISLASIWNTEIYSYVAYLVMPVQVVYYSYVLKRLFKLSFGKLMLKILLFLLVLIPVYIIFVIIAALFMIMTGSFQELLEAEKARQGISYIVSSARNWTS